MKGKEIIFALSILTLPTPTLAGTPTMMVEAETSTTIRQQMDWLHRTRKINFVYDSSLDGELNIKYHGPDIQHLSVKKALKALFEKTHILYNINANYVILKRKPIQQISTSYTNIDHKVQQVQRRHTLSGYVRDESGESLINATIYDLTDGIGTTTNEYGFFSLTLPEGEHQLRFSYVGYADKVEKLNLSKDMHHNMALRVDGKLPEVVVDGDLNSPLLTTQTGKRSFSNKDIKTEFALMSSPDVVKTLQRVSGVAEGQELASGLYVHGGNGDENLFLIDGTPLYNTNHALGLFSSFNADVVKNVDFYKSGFPARYGGRLSSVVDVRTADGNMNQFHGAYRIGLLDASVQFEGPIQKGKTSYNIGMRRSWLDLLSRPLTYAGVSCGIEWNDNHGDRPLIERYEDDEYDPKRVIKINLTPGLAFRTPTLWLSKRRAAGLMLQCEPGLCITPFYNDRVSFTEIKDAQGVGHPASYTDELYGNATIRTVRNHGGKWLTCRIKSALTFRSGDVFLSLGWLTSDFNIENGRNNIHYTKGKRYNGIEKYKHTNTLFASITGQF